MDWSKFKYFIVFIVLKYENVIKIYDNFFFKYVNMIFKIYV